MDEQMDLPTNDDWFEGIVNEGVPIVKEILAIRGQTVIDGIAGLDEIGKLFDPSKCDR